MTVVDIRNIFSNRRISLVNVGASHIYYAEEKNDEGSSLFLLEYNRSTRKERLVTNYTLDDPTFVEHIFALKESIVIILENGTNSMWLIEVDKKSGTELNRRKVVCTGIFKECMVLDNTHLLIYMSPDQANAEIFKKYRETMGCECLCYIYNLKTNVKTIVRAPLIAKAGCDGIKTMDIHGDPCAVILDPFSDEAVKESYFREQRWINADIRDNIWICRTEDLEKELESGSTTITKRCIASADIKALVRYMGIDGDKIYFRAKEFKSGTEKICSYDAFVNTLAVETAIDTTQKDVVYILEEHPFRAFALSEESKEISVTGLVGSHAEAAYSKELGSFMTCIDNRYIVTTRTVVSEESGQEHTYCYIFDTVLKKHESYECSCLLKGDTLVLY